MRGLRQIKRRIRSVKNTQQITKAMNMVSASKLRKTQPEVYAIRPYSQEITDVINSILSQEKSIKSPYLGRNKEGMTGYVVITSDRGLCGGYNSNVIKATLGHMQEKQSHGLIAVGKKGRDYFRRRNYDIKAEFLDIDDKPDYNRASNLGETVLDFFDTGIFNEVYMVYNYFISTLERKPVIQKLLPFESEEDGKKEQQDLGKALYLYEPSAGAVLNLLFPEFLKTQIYRGLVEAKVSEFSARMTAMDAATDNAEEMIDDLTLIYNRARQSEITQEITEIVGGAEALR